MATASWIARKLHAIERALELGCLREHLMELASDPAEALLLRHPRVGRLFAESLEPDQPLRLTRAASLRLDGPVRSGHGFEARLLRVMPRGCVRLTAVEGKTIETGRITLGPWTRDWSRPETWGGARSIVLPAKTPLRIQRIGPPLAVFPPALPPLGMRWGRLEGLCPDVDLLV